MCLLMYNEAEKLGIVRAAKTKHLELVISANIKDAVGCDSGMYWTIAFHIGEILDTLGGTLTASEENKLYERLIDFKNKPLN